MPEIWQLQDAKNRLSELVDKALSQGPQVITKHGQETAVVISYVEYRRLLLGQEKLADFFRQSPLVDAEFDLTRDPGSLRPDIEL